MADTEATPTLSEAAAQSVLPTYTKAELAALDESDSARAAAIRSAICGSGDEGSGCAAAGHALALIISPTSLVSHPISRQELARA